MAQSSSYLAYTIFTDEACTVVRRVVEFSGEKADELLKIFHKLNHWEPVKVGDKILGCRIDRIGSEDLSSDTQVAA